MARFEALSLVCALALIGCGRSESDELMPALPEPSGSTIESHLYPSELVLDHQSAIALTDAQRAVITSELQASQRELVDAEVALRADREALAQALASARVDEDAAMQAAARVADGERGIKLAHMRLLVRIKNQLTAAQQRSLDRLRAGL